jgi:Capsule polysaccharide biosynthesis protein
MLRERLSRRIVLERDLRRLEGEHGAAFAEVEVAADAPPVLIVSLTEFVYQLKLEGLLGTALKLAGRRPVVLVQPGSWIPRRYFEAFGIRDLVVLDDYLDERARSQAADEAALILAGGPSAAELKALRFRGASLGRHVLSTLSRSLHEGSVDPSTPDARAKLNELLPRTLESTIAAERLLDDLRPELALFLERNYAAEAPVSDLALERGIDVIQFVSGFQDDELVFKRYRAETRRLHPRSLSEQSWEIARAMPWGKEQERELGAELERRYGNVSALSRRLQEWTHDQPRAELLEALGLDPTKKTVVVFSHILWDANMFYGQDLFADQEEWFVETVRVAFENPHVNWIVKLHPANVWKLRREGLEGELDEERAIARELGELPEHVAVLRPESKISTRSVFEATDYGITIRGSVGFELPCLGVPVLTAGTGFYSGRGFTVDSGSRDEYLARLRRIEEIPPLTSEQTELARRHAYALFRLRPLRFSSFVATIRPLEEMGHPLDHDVELRIDTAEELRLAADLRRFTDWALDSQELDYLETMRS